MHSVVKTKQLWGPEQILESLKAVFTVNKKKPLLSLLTMIGPSPDWCLGESRMMGMLGFVIIFTFLLRYCRHHTIQGYQIFAQTGSNWW